MKRIYKYPVPLADSFNLFLPEDAEVLAVQTQGENDMPKMWVLLDPGEVPVSREFCLIGTGHDIPDSADLQYIGTFQGGFGTLVFHLFEKVHRAGRVS